MADNKIRTIQNLLKMQKRFDLAIKFDNAYIEHAQADEEYFHAGWITFFVNPIYFF